MTNKMWITYFLRRAFLIAFSFAILSSTVCLGTETILRASLSNAPHPCGLPIESPLLFAHKSSIVDTGNEPISQTPSEYLRQQQTEADSVKHKPSRALGNADSTAKFVKTDSVLAICDCPDRDKPFIQTEGAVLKDSPYLRTKLPSAILASHKVSGLNFPDSHSAAMDTYGRIASPTNFPHIFFANFQIGKVADGIKQDFWQIHNSLLKNPAPADAARGWTKKSLTYVVASALQTVPINAIYIAVAVDDAVRVISHTARLPNCGFLRFVGGVTFAAIIGRQNNGVDMTGGKSYIPLKHITAEVVDCASATHLLCDCTSFHFLVLSILIVINLFTTTYIITSIVGVSTTILLFFRRFIKLFVSPYDCVGYRALNYA